ncbi:YeeE/YedE family protein [Comamonas composti]|uniref:YeeE/YedE family protein n=1 Tax=Comamonas composti TaxID=408558 RepID=UPI0003F68C12|nr:YeeE/YedE family protein [Comamonas composti]
MTSADFNALSQLTLLGIFLLSLALGAVVRDSRFCTMGAISDVVYMGHWGRMRQWAMAIGVAMCGFAGLSGTGLVNPHHTLYASSQVLWLSAMVGGLLFGFGMVLASGCGIKNLVRLGEGNLKSLVVLLVMGLAALMTLKGLTAVWRVRSVDQVLLHLDGVAFLPDMLARATQWSLPWLRLVLGLAIGLLAVVWSLTRGNAERDARGLVGGALVGLAVTAAWWLSGHFAEVEEHPLTLEHMYATTQSGRAEALSFVTPVAQLLEWLMYYSDTNRVLSFGVVAALGVLVGSLVHASFRREFRTQGFADTSDLLRHLGGAVLMGVGGVTAMGCTVGQGVSAISTLHLASFAAVICIGLGAVAALRFQQWRMERAG